jgi:hypothetical protein
MRFDKPVSIMRWIPDKTSEIVKGDCAVGWIRPQRK